MRDQGRQSRPHELEPRQRTVLDAVPLRRPAPIESIALTAGVGIALVVAFLAEMEVLGLVERSDSGWRRAPASVA